MLFVEARLDKQLWKKKVEESRNSNLKHENIRPLTQIAFLNCTNNKTNERNFFFSQLSKKHKNSLPRLTNALRCLRENSDRKIAVVTTDTQTHAKSIAGIAKPKSKFHFRNSSIFFMRKNVRASEARWKEFELFAVQFRDLVQSSDL
jgi:hypothetical protein